MYATFTNYQLDKFRKYNINAGTILNRINKELSNVSVHNTDGVITVSGNGEAIKKAYDFIEINLCRAIYEEKLPTIPSTRVIHRRDIQISLAQWLFLKHARKRELSEILYAVQVEIDFTGKKPPQVGLCAASVTLVDVATAKLLKLIEDVEKTIAEVEVDMSFLSSSNHISWLQNLLMSDNNVIFIPIPHISLAHYVMVGEKTSLEMAAGRLAMLKAEIIPSNGRLILDREETLLMTNYEDIPFILLQKEIMFIASAYSAVKVIVFMGDITKEHCDIIVSSTDEKLANKISLEMMERRSGAESHTVDDWKRTLTLREDLKVGDIIETGPGILPARYIIHVAGPKYTEFLGNREAECKSTLTTMYRKILCRAMDLQAHSIALCPISAGNILIVCLNF